MTDPVMYSGSNGHSLLFVNLIFDDRFGTHFAQAGVGRGNIQGQTQIARSIYFEWNDGTPHIIWVLDHAIPDNDHGSAWSFNYQFNSGTGHYTFELGVQSLFYSSTWSTHPDVGTTAVGFVYGDTENAYFGTYSGPCNAVTQNNHSNMQYSNSVSTSPTWTSWPGSPGSCSGVHTTAPYTLVSATRPTGFQESGS